MSISGLCSLTCFNGKSRLGFCISAAIGSIVHHLFNNDEESNESPEFSDNIPSPSPHQQVAQSPGKKQTIVEGGGTTSGPAQEIVAKEGVLPVAKNEALAAWEAQPLPGILKKSTGRDLKKIEEVMDYRTYCWAIAKTYCWAIAISR